MGAAAERGQGCKGRAGVSGGRAVDAASCKQEYNQAS